MSLDKLHNGVQELAKSLEADGLKVLIVAITMSPPDQEDAVTVSQKGYKSAANRDIDAALMVGVHNQLADIFTRIAGA